jgi:hypothetical protein
MRSAVLWTFCSTNRRFQFHKRGQLFIGTHNETLSVVAVRVSNKNKSRGDLLSEEVLLYVHSVDVKRAGGGSLRISVVMV